MDPGANSLHTATKVQSSQEIPHLKYAPSKLATGEMSRDTRKLEMGGLPDAPPDINTDEQDCGLQPSEAENYESKAHEQVTVPKEHRGWRRVIRNFTPS